jgi:hypothetical protein
VVHDDRNDRERTHAVEGREVAEQTRPLIAHAAPLPRTSDFCGS